MVATKWFGAFKETLPRAEGKVFIITGTTSGTGFVAARTIGELGGEAVLLNRKSGRVDTMMENLKEAVPDGKFSTVECDLQSFDSVRKAASEIKSKYSSTGIYCIGNNAGIMATPDKATVDGFDTQIQTNHLSHFLLTAELFPLLSKYADEHGDARIVNHSSGARNTVQTNEKKILEQKYFEKNGGNLGGDSLEYMSGACWQRYSQSKLANSVFTYALADKLKASSSKIKAVACQPGGSDTNLGAHLLAAGSMGWFTTLYFRYLVIPFMCQSAEDGTMGLLRGMVGKDTESGVLYGPKTMKGEAIVNEPKPYEVDEESKKMLWTTSEEATGVTFSI